MELECNSLNIKRIFTSFNDSIPTKNTKELDLQLLKKLSINKVDRSGQNQNQEKVQHSILQSYN